MKDLFVFSCYTGLSYIDVMQLSEENVQLGIDGNKWVITNRQKTDKKVRVPLLEKAEEIINIKAILKQNHQAHYFPLSQIRN